MKYNLRYITVLSVLLIFFSAFDTLKNTFTAAEQQQISIPTQGLFSKSNTFVIDFAAVPRGEYSFPMPVGKASARENGMVEIESKEGDIVLAMFDGVVRLSRKVPGFGNVVVLRHANGLETVYGNNAQNLVKVGDRVQAGRRIAIVGKREARYVCDFSIMVNGGRINPKTIFSLGNHQLLKQKVRFTNRGSYVSLSVVADAAKDTKADGKSKTGAKEKDEMGLTLNPDEAEDPFKNNQTFTLDLTKLERGAWCYPLAGSHVISPYGGRRRHAGVDIKSFNRDKIYAAFDGVVTRSGPYFGYGNCIVIRHAYGFETLYSHQSKNMVRVGQHVKAGQVIGLTGQTGRATTPHLHFEIHFKGRRFNPNMIFNHSGKCLQKSKIVLSRGGGIRKK